MLRPLARGLAPLLAEDSLYRCRYFGSKERVTVAESAVLCNAFFNTISGDIVVEEWAFFGQNVSLLTGSHDIEAFDRERQTAVSGVGRDIRVRRGAWIGSNATVLGPCVIGEHAVVAAGAVVTRDVAPYTVVAGVPARVIREITSRAAPASS
jgi:acetyltransferase-like isoleucine patch superfamily enzyme